MDSHRPYLAQKLSMVHIVKEAFDVNIYDNMKVACLHMLFSLSQCIFHTSVRSEAIACIAEFRFTNRLHYLQNTLLYQPVHDSWNTQRSGFTVSFGNLFPSDRLGLIPLKFLLNHMNQFRFTHFCQIRNSFTIRTGRSASCVLFKISIC